MWFVVVLLCAVVAAKPSGKDHWDQAGPMNGGTLRPDPRPEPVNPVAPPEEPTLGGFPLGRPFPGQNGRGNRGEESETRPGPNMNQGTWRREQWGATGKPQRGGRSSRPPKPDRIPHGPVGGGRENEMDQLFGKPLSPNMMDNRQFLPIFKADNVTLQKTSTYHLKEGENIFLLPKGREQKQPPKGVNRPQEMGYYDYSNSGPQPYVKIIYNPTATQRISFEYGITQLLPSFMKAASESN